MMSKTTLPARPAINGEQPSATLGVKVITALIGSIALLPKTKGRIRELFNAIFTRVTPGSVRDSRYVRHLCERYTGPETLAGFFLNLDTENQIKFLNHALGARFGLDLPDIPNWKELAQRHYVGGSFDGWDQETFRDMSAGIVSEWDAYPHALVWVCRFLLFANNNSIDDKNWRGDHYGCYPNWAAYFKAMQPEQKEAFTQKLIDYV